MRLLTTGAGEIQSTQVKAIMQPTVEHDQVYPHPCIMSILKETIEEDNPFSSGISSKIQFR